MQDGVDVRRLVSADDQRGGRRGIRGIGVKAEVGAVFEPLECRPTVLPGELRDFNLPVSDESFELLERRVRWQARHRCLTPPTLGQLSGGAGCARSAPWPKRTF